MSKPRILGDELFKYPDTGDINYGEEASGWVEKATEILSDISGPGDISTTEVTLVGSIVGLYVEGDVPNMTFNTSFVQSLDISGFIKRTFTDATPDRVEQFSIEGAYNGTVVNFSTSFTGDDTEIEFSTNGGQFKFKYLIQPNTDTITMKFSAKAKIDEDFFA